MWKFIKDLEQDFDRVKNDIEDRKSSDDEKQMVEAEALMDGSKAIEGNMIVALADHTVEMINQDQNQIEIYFDDGKGMGIQFPDGPHAFKVLVSANEKVKKGQALVEFGPDSDTAAKVYAFTPNMIEVLSNSRFRMK